MEASEDGVEAKRVGCRTVKEGEKWGGKGKEQRDRGGARKQSNTRVERKHG